MATLEELLTQHEIRGKESCIAWGYEFIAKWHEKLPFAEFPIQEERPSGLGHSLEDREWFRQRFGIQTEEKHVSIDELEGLIREEVAKELPPVVCLFSGAMINYGTRALGISRSLHSLVGLEEDGKVFLAGRVFGDSETVFLRFAAVRAIEGYSAALPEHSPLISCLLHKSPA